MFWSCTVDLAGTCGRYCVQGLQANIIKYNIRWILGYFAP